MVLAQNHDSCFQVLDVLDSVQFLLMHRLKLLLSNSGSLFKLFLVCGELRCCF